jgi:transposase
MMNPPLKVNTTLTLEELEEHYRKAPSALAKQRAQVVLLRFEGMPPDEVARIVRVTPATVYKYVSKFNKFGPDCFQDGRARNPGRPPLLDEKGRAELSKMLESAPPEGGRWSGPKVARWIEARVGLPAGSLHRARGYEAMVAVGYSYKSSRPRHVESASEQEREAWKKKSGDPSPKAQAGES